MGMNRDVHRKLPSREELTSASNRLFFNAFWAHFINDSRFESLRIAGRRPEIDDALVRLTVQHSILLVPGIYFGFNEHYEIEDDDRRGEQLLSALSERWRGYQIWAKQTAEHLVSDLIGKSY